MNTKILTAFVLMSVLIISMVALTAGAGTPPSPPTAPTGGPSGSSGPGMGGAGTPPSGPGTQNAGDDQKPLKERLEAFYDAKESFINQKRQCKEESAATNAPSGTCWTKLRPVMIGILLNEVRLTGQRLGELQKKNITFSDFDEIVAQLQDARKVFEDSTSSKDLIKSTAKGIEDLVNKIEEKATAKQPEVLIRQMDNLLVKADALTAKLESKLEELRTAGNDVSSLESSLADYKANLAKAKENVASAKAKYSAGGSVEDIAAMAKEVRELINNAKNYLEKAFDKTKKMVPDMGEGNGGNNESNGENPGGNPEGNPGDTNGGSTPPEGTA